MQKLGVTHLVIGDLVGTRQDNNLGAKNNQKLHNFWSHATTVKCIKELAEEYGIEVLEQNERGTSRTCCMCSKQHNGRIHRGLHLCKANKTVINADVSGAYNILKVAVNGTLCSEHKTIECSSSRVLANPLMLRWEYHRWH